MQISRRDLFKSTAVIGGAAALGTFGGLSAEAVAGTGPLAQAERVTTRGRTFVKGAPDASGWRSIVAKPGEPYVVRTGLGAKAKKGRAKKRKPLLAFAQLSDVHICDSQSPMRYDFLDRGDDDDNHDGHIDGGGTYRSAYRPQEILGVHVADSMVRAINDIKKGPVTGKPLALALQTGDNSDNTQYNEVRWNIDVLDGATMQVDSGDLTRYEGVMGGIPDTYDVRYWHPEGTPEGQEDDLPRSRYGFPVVPGLLDAARTPFQAEGLSVKWYTAMGNHDGLLQGLKPADDNTEALAVGPKKQIIPGTADTWADVTPDPDRRHLTRAEWVAEHFTTAETVVGAPGPKGHGFTQRNLDEGTAYYTFDRGLVRFIVLDSVNPAGGETGSLDQAQFTWLKKLLKASRKKLVVIACHHTLGTMTNGSVGSDGKPRVLGNALLFELISHDNVIAWVNGHTHTNHIWAHKHPSGPGGLWEINTASHIDWPQQARLIEIADNKDGTLSIFTTVIDHSAPAAFSGDLTDPVQLAALSRELAANDWQEQESDRRGDRSARNTELLVKAPAFMR